MIEPAGGWVYLLLTTGDYSRTKIGKAGVSPFSRYAALRTADPGLYIYGAIWVPAAFGTPRQVELAIHRHMDSVRITHQQSGQLSEWFRLSPSAALEEIGDFFDERYDAKLVLGSWGIYEGKFSFLTDTELEFWIKGPPKGEQPEWPELQMGAPTGG